MRIVRAWRGFGVELHAEDGPMKHSHPFQGLVVQAAMGKFNQAWIEAFGYNSIIMVLSGDQYFSGAQVLNRMIPAMVTELEALGLSTQRPPDQLMPETDAKNGNSAVDYLSNSGYDLGQSGGIARAIG